MHSIVAAFFVGLLTAGLAALAYIRVLLAKLASYELYVTRRIDEQIASLLPSHAATLSSVSTDDPRARLIAVLSQMAERALSSPGSVKIKTPLGSIPRP
ncbi:MAG TPA: hypothetical protein VKU44_08550 [Terriglobia bacterium]|nr:hypothetical protein [Terriglobia bacterium]